MAKFFKMLFARNYRTPEEKKKLKKERLLLIVSGVLFGLSFPPFPFFFLSFVALIPFLYVLESRTRLLHLNQAAFLMGFVFSLITVYWVGAFTEMKDPFLAIAGGVLFFFNPLFFLVPATLLYLARKIFSPRTALLLFPLFFVSYEFLYNLSDLAFPWLMFGHAVSGFTAFIQIADLIGAIGLSLIIVSINMLLFKSYTMLKEKKSFYIPAGIALLLIILPCIYGLSALSKNYESGKHVKIGIVQPNLDPYEKWGGRSLKAIVTEYLDLSRKAAWQGAEVIIWPETALPVYLLNGSYAEEVDSIRTFIEDHQVTLLTGMPDIRFYMDKNLAPPDAKSFKKGDGWYASYNSILAFSPVTEDVQRYGKMKLVPFGERVPFVDALPFLQDWLSWGVGMSGWNVGQDTTVFTIYRSRLDTSGVRQKDTLHFAGIVCYESIFPNVVAAFNRKEPEMFFVVTNDSWYGNTSGPYQHKEISVLRAVETRKPFIRAANGGISCYIDPKGKTIAATKMYDKALLVVDVALGEGTTFYSKHPMIVSITSAAVSLWIIGFSLLAFIKRKLG